jgi:hypothetical protein
MPKDIPSSVDGFGLLGCIRPLAQAVEVLQQSIEASGSGARVQVDAADLLQTELYIGRLVWNKVRIVNDPATAKRVSRPNPRNEWQAADVPELAILSRELPFHFHSASNRSMFHPAKMR